MSWRVARRYNNPLAGRTMLCRSSLRVRRNDAMNLTNSPATKPLTKQGLWKSTVPNKKERLVAILKFFLFAGAMVLVLVGFQAALRKIPATASLLHQLDAGTMTASLVLVIDSLGLLAVLILSALAAKLERQPVSAFGLPLRDAFQKRFWQEIGRAHV